MQIKALLLLILPMIFFNYAYADNAVQPIINRNVPVMQGGTAAQCPSNWKGDASTADIQVDSAQGINNNAVASGVRSCTGCAFDQASGNCICDTCYDNYN